MPAKREDFPAVTPQKLRNRALAEWRGLPQKPPAPDRTVAVADALGKLMQSLGLGERLKAEAVTAAWRDIVGDFVAEHSTPRQLKDGVLSVSILQPTVHFELERHWKPKILANLKARFGAKTVREVRFRIG